MPTEFDSFTPAAHRATIMALPDSDEKKRNFLTLDRYMREAGYVGDEKEWWHYNFREWRRYPILDIDAYHMGPNS
jgi:D-alanyl-D-alanine dipeptidase